MVLYGYKIPKSQPNRANILDMKKGVGTAGSEKMLGRAIADARRKAGLTQQELCFKANMSYSTLAKIERGAIRTPSIFTVAAIAAATGASIEQLAGIDTTNGSKTPQKAYKTSKSGVKFVYFDVNGVIVHYYQRAFTNIAADTGVEPAVVEAIFWHYNDAVCRGRMSLEQFNAKLAERVGVGQISWADYYLKNVDPIDDVGKVIEWASGHFGVGLMTNIMPGLLDALIKKGVIPNLDYEAIVDSSKEKAIKPEVAIYERAATLAEVLPKEILLIDDDRANLMAAERLGWHVLWFDDYHPKDSETRIRQLLEY